MRKKNSPTSPAWRGNFRIFSSKLPLQFSTSFLESGRFQKAKMLENRINPGFFYLSFGRTHHFWKENTIHLSPGSAKIAWPGDFSYLCCPGQGLVFHCLCPICPRPASFLRTDFPKSSTKTAPHLSVFCVSAPRAAHLRLAMLYASRKIFLFFVYSTAIFEVGGACLFAEKKEVILPPFAAFSPPTGYSSDSSGNCPKIAATPVLTHRRMALRWEKMASVTP